MKFILGVLTLFLCISANAQSTVTEIGCWVNGQDKIFVSRTSSTRTLNTYSQAKGYKVNFNMGDPARVNDCDMANPNTAVSTGKNCTVTGEQWNVKGEYKFTYIPCTNVPLDDHIWLVMLVVMGLGAFYLSKSKFAFPS